MSLDKINYFNFCSVILFVILIISTFARKMTRGKSNHIFILLMFVSLSSACFDCLAVLMDNEEVKNIALKRFMHSGYLFFHNATLPVYMIYLISLTDTWHKMNKKFKLFLILPFVVTVVMLIVNLFDNCVFYFDKSNVYTRGPMMFLLYISASVYIVYGIGFLYKYRNLFTQSRYVVLMAMFPLMIGAVCVQIILPFLLVEMIMNAVCMLFISMMIQRPEETIDIITELRKFSAYADDMKRGFKNEKPVDIILVNIANFNSIREILEYDSVNELLKQVADGLCRLKVNADLYYLDRGRFRLVVDKRHSDETENIAEKVNELLKKNCVLREMEINIVAHVCIAHCPEEIGDFKTLIAFGLDFHQRAVYTGKVIFASDLIKEKRYDLMRNIDTIIENAIVNNKFKVYYQPIYSVEKQRFTSAEALLRLIDDEYGFVSPEVFIPAAEKSGAIHRIGAYVLEEVCRFISSKEYEELEMEYIEINLSVAQCMHQALVGQVLEILDRYKITPDKINLEITETAADNVQNTMMDNITQLSDKGISFSLDDFGTGYSNIRRVASLPLKIVKLDKSFTVTENNPKMLIVLQNTIKMLKAMNIEIVVEGIETEELAKQFSDMKCEYIQGYYYSKPIPQNEFIEFVKKSLISA